MSDGDVRAVLTMDGNNAGLVKAMEQVQATAEATGASVVRLSETVSAQSDAYIAKAQERIDMLQQKLARVQEFQGAAGEDKLAAQTEALARARDTAAQAATRLKEAETALAVATKNDATAQKEVEAAQKAVEAVASSPWLSKQIAARDQLGRAMAAQVKSSSELAAAEQKVNEVQQASTAADSKAAEEASRLTQVRHQVSTADADAERIALQLNAAELKIAATENTSVNVRMKLGTETKAMAAETKTADGVFGQFASSLSRAIALIKQAGVNMVQSRQELGQAGTYFKNAGTELKGLGAVVDVAKAAWTTYLNEVRQTHLAFTPGTSAIVTFIATVSSAVRSATSWASVSTAIGLGARSLLSAFMSAGSAVLNIAKAFGTVAQAGASLASGALTAIHTGLTKIGEVAGTVKNAFGGLETGFATTGTHLAGLAVKLQGAQLGLYSLGMGMTAFAQQAGNMFTGLLSQAADFQQKVVTIQAVLGKAAGDLAVPMRNIAIALGEKTLFSPSEAADVMNNLVMGGLSAVEVMGKLKDGSDGAAAAVLQLSTATGTTLAQATDAVISSTREWANQNLTAKQSVEDMTKVANATATTIDQLIGGMKNAGGVAATMGVSFHDTLDLLGALSNAGLKGPEAGTGLRYFLLNLVPSTQAGIDLMKQLGLETYNVGEAARYAEQHHIQLQGSQENQLNQLYQQYAGTTKTFQQAIDDGDKSVAKFQGFLGKSGILSTEFVDGATGNLKSAADILQTIYDKVYAPTGGGVQATKLLEGIFGARGGAKAAAPLMIAFQKNLDDYHALQARMKTETGQALADDQKMLDSMDSNLINTINKQLGNYGGAAEIADARTKTFSGSMHYLQSSVQGFQISLGEPLLQPLADLLRMMGDVVNQATQWAQANPTLIAAVGRLVELGIAFAAVAGPVLMLGAAWPMVIAALGGVAAAVAPLAIVLTLLGGAFMAIALMLGDPNSGVMSALSQAGNVFGTILPELVAAGTHIILSVFLPLGEAIVSLITTKIIPAALAAGQWLGTNLPRMIDGVIVFITQTFLPTLGRVVDWFLQLLPNAIQFGMGLWNNVLLPAFQFVFAFLVNWLLPTFQTLLNWLSVFIPQAVHDAAQIFNTVLVPVFATILTIIRQYLLPAFEQLTMWLAINLPPVVNFLANLWSNILAPALLLFVGLLTNFVLPALENLVAFALNNFGVIATVIGVTLVPAFIAWATAAASAAIATIVAFAPVVAAIAVVVVAIAAATTAWNNNFLGVQDVVKGVANFLSGVWTNVVQAIQWTVNAIGGALDWLQGKAHTDSTATGQAIAQGTEQGMQGAESSVKTHSDNILGMLHAGSGPAGTFGYDTGESYRSYMDERLLTAEGQVQGHIAHIVQTMADGVGQVDDKTKAGYATVVSDVEDLLGKNLSDTVDWHTRTVAEVAAMSVDVNTRTKEIGTTLVDTLQQAYGKSFSSTLDWKDRTLGTLVETIDPAGTHTKEIGARIQAALADQLGVTLNKTADWQHMTLAQLVAMAEPSGKAAQATGLAFQQQLATKLGLTLKDIQNFGGLSLSALGAMVKPAGDSGYATGYNFTAGLAKGIDSNMDAVVARVKFLRQQLGIAVAIEAKLANGTGQKGMLDEQGAIKARNAAKYAADTAAANSGIPSFLLDFLAGPDPTAPTGLGAFTPSSDGGPDHTGDPNSGSNPGGTPPSNPYDTNTNAPGKTPKASTAKTPSASTKTAAQAAADVAKSVAQAIKDGVDALARISGLQVPADLTQKAKQFADAVTVLVMALQDVAEKFSDKGLAHTLTFADTADKVMTALKTGLDVFTKLQDFTPPAEASIAALVQAVNRVVLQFALIASKYKVDALAQLDVYTSSATAAVDLVGKAADAFVKMQDFVAPTEASIALLVHSVAVVVSDLAPLASQYAPQILDNITAYSDAAGKAMDGLTKAVDFFVKLNTLETSLDGAASKAKGVVDQSHEIVVYLTQLVGQDGFNAKTDDLTTKFSDAVAKTMDGLTKAVDFFTKLNDPKTNLTVAQAKVEALVREAQYIVVCLETLVSEQPGLPAMNDKLVTRTSAYADAVGKVSDGLIKAADLFAKLNDPKLDLHPITEKVRLLSDESVAMMNYMSDLWAKQPAWDEAAATKVATYADAVAKVSDGLLKAATFFSTLDGIKTDFKDLAGRVSELANASSDMMNKLGPVAARWPAFSDTLTQYADTLTKTADGLTKSVEFLDKLAGSSTSFKDLAGRVTELVNASQDIMAQVAKAVPANYLQGALPDYMDAASKTADALDKVLTLLTNLGQGKKLGSMADATQLTTDLVALVKAYEAALAAAGIELTTADSDAEKLSASIADSQTKILDTILKAFDLFSKLSAVVKTDTQDPNAQIQPLLTFLLNVVQAFKAAGTQFAAAANDQTAVLSKQVGDTVTGIAGAVDLFEKLSTYTAVPDSAILSFLDSLRLTVQHLRDGLLNDVTPDMLDLAEQFGTKLDPAFKLLDSALSLFEKLQPDSTTTTSAKGKTTTKAAGAFNGVDPARVALFIALLRATIQQLKVGLLDQVAPEMLDLAEKFGTKVAPAIDVLSKSLDMFLKIQGDGTKGSGLHTDPAAIGALVYGLYVLLHNWNNVVQGGEFQGNFAARSAAFAQTVGTVLTALQSVLTLAENIAQAQSKSAVIAQLPALIKTISGALSDLVSAILPETASGLADSLTQMNATSQTKLYDIGQAFKLGMGAMAQIVQHEGDGNTAGTLQYYWSSKGAGLIWMMWKAIEGKGGFRVVMRLAWYGVMSDIQDAVAQSMPELVKQWRKWMVEMKQDTLNAVADIKAAIQTLNDIRVSITITTTTGGGKGGQTMPPTSTAPPPPPGRAEGGDVGAGWYTVGERGPELLHAGGPGTVVKNGAGSPGGPVSSVTNYFNIREVRVDQVTDLNLQLRRDRALGANNS